VPQRRPHSQSDRGWWTRCLDRSRDRSVAPRSFRRYRCEPADSTRPPTSGQELGRERPSLEPSARAPRLYWGARDDSRVASEQAGMPSGLSRRCPWEPPKQRLESQRQPTHPIREVKDTEGFPRTNEDGRNADRSLANRCVNAASRVTSLGPACRHPFLREPSWWRQIAVSDRGSLRGLTQFARSTSVALFEPAESKWVLREAPARHRRVRKSFRVGCNSFILKRRDAGAVDQARLEIALTVCDGVCRFRLPLQIQRVNATRVTPVDCRKPR
jgi:hypothetical protein